MTRRADGPVVVVHVNGDSRPHDSTDVTHLSPGENSGKLSGPTGSRSAILQQFRDQAPARWMAFLHAHFSGPAEVAAFFDTDEKTGRNWWNGKSRPTVDKALFAEMEFPHGYRRYMLAAE